MTNPILKVILQAKDNVSDVAEKATSAIAKFSQQVTTVLKGVAGVAAGLGLGAFFKAAIEEAADAQAEMARLSRALRNAGADMGQVVPQAQELVDTLARVAGVSGGDVSDALARLVTVSGNVDGSLKNMSLVMDLAAARGLDLESAADLVGKAMNGNVTAMNKLGVAGKDATTVLGNARKTFDGFAEAQGKTFIGTMGRMNESWDQFKEKVGGAIIGSDGARTSLDWLGETLVKVGRWVEENEGTIGRLADGVLTLGHQVFVAGGAIYDSLRPALGVVIVPLKLLLSGVATLSYGFGLFAQTVKFTVGDVIYSIGTLIGRGANLLNAFGIKVGYETALQLRESGERMQLEATFGVEKVRRVFVDGMDALWKAQERHHAQMEGAVENHGDTVTRTTQGQVNDRVKLAKAEAAERERILKEVNAKLEQGAKGLNLATAELAGYWQQVDREARKAATTIAISKDEQRQLTDFSRSHAQAQAQVAEAAEEAQRRFEDNVDSAQSLGLSLISAANGMGRLSDTAASALTAVVNMGASIAKFGIGSPEGILSIVGGLAQLIGGWGSSPAEQARREAHMKNTRAIEDLSRDLSEYNGSASGETFGTVLDALEGAKYTKEDGSTGVSLGIVKAHLASRGMTLADARALADKYGIDVDKDPDGWTALLEVMRRRRFGSPSGNFGDELSALTDSFGVLGVEDADDKLAAFRDFARKNIPSLADALQGDLSTESGRAAIVAKLRDLYSRSLTQQLTPAEFGKATPQQFRALISTLLPLLGDANGLLASGLSVGTGVTNGPVGTPGTGGTAGSIGVSSPALAVLGATGIPVPRFPDAFLTGGEVASGNTILQGDFIVQTNITGEGRDPRDTALLIADEVSRILGSRLTAQRQALGAGGAAA